MVQRSRRFLFSLLFMVVVDSSSAAVAIRQKRQTQFSDVFDGITRMIQGQKTQLSDFGVNLTPDEKAKATSAFDNGSLMLQALVESIKTDGLSGVMKVLSDPNAAKGLIGGGQGTSSSSSSRTGSGSFGPAPPPPTGTFGPAPPPSAGSGIRPSVVSGRSSVSAGGNSTSSRGKDVDYEAYYRELLGQSDDHHS